MKATEFEALLRLPSTAGVEFIVVGGVAAIFHGSAHVTYDLDVVYRRAHANIDRIATALRPLQPYVRGRLPGFPSGSIGRRSNAA